MEIYKKLANVKKQVGAISKDNLNPFHKNKYFDINTLLEQVEPIIDKEGLLLLQPVNDGKVTTQIIDLDSGEKVESSIVMTDITDPQKMGSAITYYRRYTLQSLLALKAEDDDGNKARKKPQITNLEGAIQAIKQGKYTVGQILAKYQVTNEEKEQLWEASSK